MMIHMTDAGRPACVAVSYLLCITGDGVAIIQNTVPLSLIRSTVRESLLLGDGPTPSVTVYVGPSPKGGPEPARPPSKSASASTLVQSAVLRSHVVRLSVTLVDQVHMDWQMAILETKCTNN